LLVAVPAGAGALAACRLPDPGCRLGALPCAAQTPRAHVAWDEPQVRICNRDLHDNIAALTDDERVAALVQAAKLSAVAARVGDEPLEPMAACCPAAKANGCVSRALARGGVRLAVLEEPLRGLDRSQRHRLLTSARQRWRRPDGRLRAMLDAEQLFLGSHGGDPPRSHPAEARPLDARGARPLRPRQRAARPLARRGGARASERHEPHPPWRRVAAIQA